MDVYIDQNFSHNRIRNLELLLSKAHHIRNETKWLSTKEKLYNCDMVDWAIVTLLYLGINSYGWITSWLLVIGHIHGEDGLIHGHGVVEHEHVDGQGLPILPSKTRSHPSKRSGGGEVTLKVTAASSRNRAIGFPCKGMEIWPRRSEFHARNAWKSDQVHGIPTDKEKQQFLNFHTLPRNQF